MQLVFPPTLTPRQRAVLHEIAETSGIQHTSQGVEQQRHIVLGSSNANKVGQIEII